MANIVGMDTALSVNCEQLDSNKKHIKELERILINALSAAELDFIQNGSRDHLPGNISLSFRNSSGEMLLHRLDLKGICVSTSAGIRYHPGYD